MNYFHFIKIKRADYKNNQLGNFILKNIILLKSFF